MGLALLVVVLFFVTKDSEDLMAWADDRLPRSYRSTATALGSRAWTALSGYVRGTATIALIDALGIGLALLVLWVGAMQIMVDKGKELDWFGSSEIVILALLAALLSLALVRSRTIAQPGHYAFISVEDDGPGIAPDQLGRIFEPFFSTKGAGRGLGLAAVIGIVNAHRGSIIVDTEEDQGTTFTVLFPEAAKSRSGAETVTR